jgi:hypothetical protein
MASEAAVMATKLKLDLALGSRTLLLESIFGACHCPSQEQKELGFDNDYGMHFAYSRVNT